MIAKSNRSFHEYCWTLKSIFLNYVINKYDNAKYYAHVDADLFFFSDLMLLFDVFANMPKIFDYLCLITYYPAEFLLALTILLQSKELTNIRIYENNKQK